MGEQDKWVHGREGGVSMRKMLLAGVLLALVLVGWAEGDTTMFASRNDLIENVPADFPRFYFSGSDDEAQWLSRYLWYHFSTRSGYGSTLFNQEYLTTSDLWLGGALHPRWPKAIQDIHRDCLLGIRQDPSGYVNTHQHFSHAHDLGWPFPMWTLAPAGPDGKTAGWHFQDDGPGWVWDQTLRPDPNTPYARARAIEGWNLDHVRSLGIGDGKWQLESEGVSPAITTPPTVQIEAYCAPFLQLRWTRTGTPPEGVTPYVEWLREGDAEFSADRRVQFGFRTGNPDYEVVSHSGHSMIEMWRHPLWEGKIKRIRIALAPGESDVRFGIDSFFTCFDTRHSINDPIYILACWNYFRWTGDTAFLSSVLDKMRLALRYQQTEMGGLEYNRIHNTWVGHDGVPGFTINPDGSKTVHHGHSVGTNYWDILPFGWDDTYATSQYYASVLAMADAEQAVRAHPEWGLPAAGAFEPETLREHAAEVKKTANRMFWNRETGRFVACIDKEGVAHDYGFTFLNLDAIWYGIASDAHAQSILDWLGGKRIVAGDTSTGADIYHWRFGPRATTKRNVDWYFWGWTAPESIPWGGQVQDGGAVLGFSFYDLWARLEVLGPDDAWQRLRELLAWEREVWTEGGYRAYYKDGNHGTTLQGSGTAGGIGVDAEFYESSLVPAIIINGFLGIDPSADALVIRPRLPEACPEMGVSNVLYRKTRLDIKAAANRIEIALKETPAEPVRIQLEEGWRRADSADSGPIFTLGAAGRYAFERP